ncbi:MAG: hypothetical protein Q7U34_16080, partial [Anaerolineales bacterium]|nr:hypothetical protein [Anaerolineales bacterium]
VHSFLVLVEANNSEDAAQAADTFIGYSDDSTEKYRQEHQFRIHKIEMIENDVMEILPVELSE